MNSLVGQNFQRFHDVELKSIVYPPNKLYQPRRIDFHVSKHYVLDTATFLAVFSKTSYVYYPSVAFTEEFTGRWSKCRNMVTPEMHTHVFEDYDNNSEFDLRGFTMSYSEFNNFSRPVFACYKIMYKNGKSTDWMHSGLLIDLPGKVRRKNDLLRVARRKRNDEIATKIGSTRVAYFFNNTNPIIVQGLTLVTSDAINKVEMGEDGLSILADSDSTIRLFGSNFLPSFKIKFTVQGGKRDERCDEYPSTIAFEVERSGVDNGTGTVVINLPPSSGPYYICVENVHAATGFKEWVHQGSAPYTTVTSVPRLLPLWLQGCIVFLLLLFSGLFSGLNLGLMAMDKTELKIVSSVGTESEKKWAKSIMPVRKRGNYLLCSLLLGNVLVNSTLTIFLDDMTSGIVAIIVSTLAIVIFGEIIPQAICSRHGLAVGAKTVLITKFFMLVTFPLSFPISLLLDVILGEEIGNVYNRERLKELIKVTNEYNDLEKDEVNIISGTLELKKKQVGEVMTKLEDMFMLPIDACLDFETVSLIMEQGYSRIPVYDTEPHNVVDLLFIKDLAFIDPDDETPLRQLCQFHKNPINFVFEDTRLDIMLNEFKTGAKGHMAFVQRVNTEGEGDPFYEVIGLVTLEDVIEEMIQSEIVDETDIFYDNKSRKRITTRKPWKQDFSSFIHPSEKQKIPVSPHLLLATYQYLSTSVEPFRPPLIADKVLHKLLKLDIIKHIKLKSKNDRPAYIYEIGKPADHFTLILEGRVEVIVGREEMVFESGPFTYFGVHALLNAAANQEIGQSAGNLVSPDRGSITHPTQSVSMDNVKSVFIPDYSVRAATDVILISIKQQHYVAALRATKFLQKREDFSGKDDDRVDLEIDQMLEKVGGSPPGESPMPLKKSELADGIGGYRQLSKVLDLKLQGVSQISSAESKIGLPNGQLDVEIKSPSNYINESVSKKPSGGAVAIVSQEEDGKANEDNKTTNL